MINNNKLLLFLPLSFVLTLLSGNAFSADSPMICAVTQAISCQKEGDCLSGTANEFNMPVLLRINPDKNEILSKKESGEHQTSIIRQITRDKENRFVIYQGVEPGGAWSTVIDTTTGSMTVSISAGESDAYIVFGTCSASLLKP